MRLYLIIHVKRCQDKNMTCHGNPSPNDNDNDDDDNNDSSSFLKVADNIYKVNDNNNSVLDLFTC
jgi:hypothetical protein